MYTGSSHGRVLRIGSSFYGIYLKHHRTLGGFLRVSLWFSWWGSRWPNNSIQSLVVPIWHPRKPFRC